MKPRASRGLYGEPSLIKQIGDYVEVDESHENVTGERGQALTLLALDVVLTRYQSNQAEPRGSVFWMALNRSQVAGIIIPEIHFSD